jgi:hypothetical protein
MSLKIVEKLSHAILNKTIQFIFAFLLAKGRAGLSNQTAFQQIASN